MLARYLVLNLRLGRRRNYLLCASLAVIGIAGCSSGPYRVNQPSIDPEGAGAMAMELYDTNGDGKVAGDELEKAPGLKALARTADSDHDGALTADEIAARIYKWKEQKTGVTIFSFVVTLDGKPVEGANVVFEPEPFLGGEIKAGVGSTGFGGSGGASIPKDQRPSPTSPPGMHLGLYKVKISKQVNGAETIPAKYNTATTLGQEVAGDVPEISSGGVAYKLTSP
ncbi:MAG: hypothetical protein AB7G28_15010 [Pirellulales bacterium]